MFKRVFPIAALFGLVLSACATTAQPAPPTLPTSRNVWVQTPSEAAEIAAPPQLLPTASAQPTARTLKVMTHDTFAVSEEVVTAFEKENNVKVDFLKLGDAGTALNKAILSKSNPLADVFYGVDNTFLSRALTEGIFEPYTSPLLSQIPDQFKLDPQNQALPVDYGDVCLNYDKNYFKDKSIAPPQNLGDLLKPDYKSLLVVENPATSSTGLAFLLATIGQFGENGYLDYWKRLVGNDVLVVNDWTQAYYTEFTRGGGTRPVVVSYGSSPAFEVVDASKPASEPEIAAPPQLSPTAAVVSDGSCFRQIEFVGILKGTPNRDLAEKWVDFMLGTTFQEDMPLQMYVFPVNQQAKLNDVFSKFLVVPQKPAYVSPADIAANREKWIQAWTQAVLR
jgi:thiamine transport system substrate-binding protein